MTWSYSQDPSNSAEDAVRFLLNDTDENDPKLQDEEINWLLTQENNDIYAAAQRGAQKIAAMYSSKVTKAVGDLKIDYSTRAEMYQKLVETLQDMAASGTGLSVAPWMDGIETADLREPAFRVGMHDAFPQTALQPYQTRDGSPYDPA